MTPKKKAHCAGKVKGEAQRAVGFQTSQTPGVRPSLFLVAAVGRLSLWFKRVKRGKQKTERKKKKERKKKRKKKKEKKEKKGKERKGKEGTNKGRSGLRERDSCLANDQGQFVLG